MPTKSSHFTKDDMLIDKWCLVSYNSRPYVARIVEQDDEVGVHALRKVSENKFVISDDLVVWYAYHDIITIINAPEHKSERQLTLDDATRAQYFK